MNVVRDPKDRWVLPELRPWVWNFLTSYQREGIVRAVCRRNFHLWWPCGAGKSVAAMAWALAEQGPVLILCRASARRQWANEIRNFTTIDPFVVLPASAQRPGDETLPEHLWRMGEDGQRPFVIAGWDSLREDEVYRDLTALVDRSGVGGGAGSVVADESHMMKDHRRYDPIAVSNGDVRFTPRTTIAARAAFLLRKASRRLGLTATPTPDRTRDLWGQLDAIEPGCMGRYFDWSSRFCDAHQGEYGRVDTGTSNPGELRRLLASRSHVVSSAEVNRLLPPVRRMTTYLTASDLGRNDGQITRKIRLAAKAARGGTGTEDTEAAENLLELRLMQTAARKIPHVGKSVAELLLGGQKILVFTGRRRDVDKIAAAIRKALVNLGAQGIALLATLPAVLGGPEGSGTGAPNGLRLWTADGSMPGEAREEIRAAYMAHKGPAAIVCTGASFGESLNLHDTDRLIIVLLPWTWGQIRQWEGRVRRLGMLRPCIIEYLVATGTVDERVAAVVLTKLAQVESVLPDEQIQQVREAVQGGTDDELIDGLLDRLIA